MSKTKILILGMVGAVVVAVVCWRRVGGASRVDVADAHPTTAITRDQPASPGMPQPPKAASAGAPNWEVHLQQIANLAGRVEQSELDVEIEDLARDLPDEDILVALNLQLLPGADRMPVIASLNSLLIKRWSERAPADAAAWIARLPDDAFKVGAYRQVAMAWAIKDLAAAVTWLQQLPESGSKAAAQFVVSYEAAQKKESATALALASGLPPSPERDQLTSYSVLQWATVDRTAAVTWAQQVPNPGLREEILGKVAVAWGIQDPVWAAEFAYGTLPGGSNQENALVNIVRCWGSVAPETAGAWVENMPDGKLRDAVSQSLIEVWARNDPDKAGDWLSRLPPSRSRDIAVGVLAPLVASSSREVALRWAETIRDEQLRASVMTQMRNL